MLIRPLPSIIKYIKGREGLKQAYCNIVLSHIGIKDRTGYMQAEAKGKEVKMNTGAG